MDARLKLGDALTRDYLRPINPRSLGWCPAGNMEEILTEFVQGLSLIALLAIIAVCLVALGKGADILVEQAVALSLRHGISKVIIGATIVSLGTTLPEVTISVMSAIKGKPDLALGNAIGSVICDTGLILGIAAMVGHVPIDLYLMRRQGLLCLVLGFLIIIVCLPFGNLGSMLVDGGRFPQIAGFCFLAILAGYLWISARWAKNVESEFGVESHGKGSTRHILMKLIFGLVVVVSTSHVLIHAVEETAIRANVPQSVIAATLVAFGTSLPELVTSVMAVRKGHGELAIGNVVGADILNILLVAGASAAITPNGLTASADFFTLIFPAMIVLMLIFQASTFICTSRLTKWTGACLLGSYLCYLGLIL